MRKSNITNLNILGITPETENNIPSQLTDLDDGSTIIESITSLENNKQDNLSSEQLEAINSGITAGKIMQSPYTTSETNPLVNQDFVNSSIATNTANFISTFSNMEELKNYQGTLTNNDYAFVVNSVITDNGRDWTTFGALDAYDKNLVTDFDYAWVENGTKFDLYRFDIKTQTWVNKATNIDKSEVTLNTQYNRYKYNGTTREWIWEYPLNNSSFTAAQWAAINSGITHGHVEQIATNTANITNIQNSKQDTLTAGTGITIDSNNVISSSVDTSNLVTLDTTTQTFAGNKDLLIGTNNIISIKRSTNTSIQTILNGSSVRCRNAVGGDYAITPVGIQKNNIYTAELQNKNGTLALTSDIDTAKSELQSQIGDIGTLLDTINGEAI